MRRFLFILVVILSAFIGAVVGSYYTIQYIESIPDYKSIRERQTFMTTRSPDSTRRVPIGVPDFQYAAKLITPSVVNINTVYSSGEFSLNPLDINFNPFARPSGSGVIVTDDGYIITNNHVIEDATGIEVVLQDNQRYFAKVIGRDPSTDLALLKVKARNLPFIRYGDSDTVVPGEWVLAVGNPFDLNSTVTAGIVSAKARNIGILRDKNALQVESFIQTDAAVNPGNSGGALVNLKGELIGINSAIATLTGSYQGYSFAIPVNLVKKIADDLLEFGIVQRGLLGVQIRDVTAKLAESEDLDVVRGVFVSRVNEGSAAQSSGLQDGDVITAINGRIVGSVSELQELVARHRPGHAIKVTYRRKKKDHVVETVLKNFDGLESISRPQVLRTIEGATLEDLTHTELAQRHVDGGVWIRQLEEGKWKKAGIRAGYVITHIDKVNVDNVEDLNRVLGYKSGAMLVEGFYKDGDKAVYGVDW